MYKNIVSLTLVVIFVEGDTQNKSGIRIGCKVHI